MSIPSRFADRRSAVAAGWFSRRHETSAAHIAAQDKWRRQQEAKRFREELQRENTALRAAARQA